MILIKENFIINFMNLLDWLLKQITPMLGFRFIRYKTNDELMSDLLYTLDRLAEPKKQRRIIDKIGSAWLFFKNKTIKERISKEWKRRYENESYMTIKDSRQGDGMLTAFRYHPGQEGKTVRRRHAVLDYILEFNLPPVNSKEYMKKNWQVDVDSDSLFPPDESYNLLLREHRRKSLMTIIQAVINLHNNDLIRSSLREWELDMEFLKNKRDPRRPYKL